MKTYWGGLELHLFTNWSLMGQKKGFYEFAFSADRHFREPSEPCPCRHFGFLLKPFCEEH